MNWQIIFLIYCFLINLCSFLLFAIDKWKARHNKWRIPEATLLGFCVLGGSVGGLFAMYRFHHKTRKPRFRFGVPAILFLQVAIGVFLFIR